MGQRVGTKYYPGTDTSPPKETGPTGMGGKTHGGESPVEEKLSKEERVGGP